MQSHKRAGQIQQRGHLCLCLWIVCLLALADLASTDQSCDAGATLAADAPAAGAATSAQHAQVQHSQQAPGSIFIASVTLSNGGGNIIRDALLSVVGWVDACILLDTGIADDTVEVARQAAGSKLLLQRLPWPGSFAEARNAALDAAAAAGAQWAVILDTDERIRCSAAAAAAGGDAGGDQDCSSLLPLLRDSSAAIINMLHESATYHKVSC
uniref:Glycosyltransferase 2-like domain-containing protein n=1 Tax=Tetradesmus obliquus TaxID=3088 RepID=A0A383VCA1_TETOB|eukprot:jgi/Sobl393_1/19290/SZX63207.1